MRLKKFCLSLGLGLLAAVPGVNAADWNNGAGGLKDGGRTGVAIPAPIPVMETFKWYLRADIGGGLLKGGNPSAQGEIYGFDRDPLEGPAFGMHSAWFNNGFDTFASGGVGAGLYLTPRLRADATIDVRTKNDIDVQGNYTYTGDPAIYNNPLGTGYTARMNGTTREQTQVRGTLALANLYWDLTERGSTFVPYIGAGVGFVVRSLDRRHTTVETLYDTSTTPGVDTFVNNTTITGQSKTHQLAPAAAAMAGFGYTLNQGMVLDFNYRYTYLGSVDVSTGLGYSAAIGGVSSVQNRLTIGDTHEHALRAGVRWNVW